MAMRRNRIKQAVAAGLERHTQRLRSRQKKDIHTWFSDSYVDYLVLPRTLLQSMPPEWQARFTLLLDEYNAAFVHVEQSEYRVYTGEWVCVEDCDSAMLKTAGVTRVYQEMTDEQAMNVVERYLVVQGVGWEFGMADLYAAVGDTVGRPYAWFPAVAAFRLLGWGMVESIGEHAYRTTEHLEHSLALTPAEGDFPEPLYYWEGQELNPGARVFIPGPDPIPDYDRGRAHVEPYGGATR